MKGIQDQHVIANAKHWVLNSQETDRGSVSENAPDERVLFEIYYPPFEGAIAAGVGSVMCSYNKMHDKYSCENPTTLAQHLKKDLNFTGWVMSGAFCSPVPLLSASLRIQLQRPKYIFPTASRAHFSEPLILFFIG